MKKKPQINSEVNQEKFPDITFWDKDAPQVQFINSDDFRHRDLLQQLGLNYNYFDLGTSFGTYSVEEIRKRQSLLRLLIEQPDLMAKVLDLQPRLCEMPYDDQMDFLRAFPPNQKHNPFWEMVISLTQQIRTIQREDSTACPPELSRFCDVVEEMMPSAEELECLFSEKVTTEITKSTRLIGTVTLKRCGSSWEVVSTSGGGYQQYSYLLANWHDWEPPDWTENIICRWLGLRRIAQTSASLFNHIRRRHRYDAYVINEVPSVIVQAISHYVIRNFGNNAPRSGKADYSRDWITFSFSYDGSGLRLWLTKLRGDHQGDSGNFCDFREMTSFDGFSARQWRRFNKIANQSRKLFDENTKKFAFQANYWNFLQKHQPGLISYDGQLINNQEVDSRFKWYSLQALYETSCAQEYQAVIQTRNWISSQLTQLRNLAQVAQALMQRSVQWQLPLSFPQILDDGAHLISFNRLDPIHLIDIIPKGQPLVPLGPISLNGQLLGFTGQNAGGKTAGIEAIINMVWMALSGLPGFGQEIRLNPKKAVGLMFLERGAGSTFQLQLRKAKKILEAVQEIEPNAMALFLDEIGTGTAQVSGLDFGKKLLRKLHESGPSIVFSTQIPELASFAQEIGAICYAFNLDHSVQTGIGASGAEELIRQEGLSDLLE